MRRCYYTYDDKAGKVLIPGCMPAALSNDIRDCICQTELTFNQFEKMEYNKILNEKQKYIQELEKEIIELHKSMKKKKCKCKNSSWNRDVGCFVCDDCNSKI